MLPIKTVCDTKQIETYKSSTRHVRRSVSISQQTFIIKTIIIPLSERQNKHKIKLKYLKFAALFVPYLKKFKLVKKNRPAENSARKLRDKLLCRTTDFCEEKRADRRKKNVQTRNTSKFLVTS